jgi:hypothetical protein
MEFRRSKLAFFFLVFAVCLPVTGSAQTKPIGTAPPLVSKQPATSATTESLKHPGTPEIADPFRTSIYRCWACSVKPFKFFVTVEGDMGSDGVPEHVHLVRSCMNIQADADCLQAVLAVRNTRWLNHYLVEFNSAKMPGHVGKHYAEQKDSVSLYIIPLSVLDKFPGLFSEQELLNKNNCVYLKCDDEGMLTNGALDEDTLVSMTNHYYHWNQFLNSHPNPTRKQISAWAAGHKFVKPSE